MKMAEHFKCDDAFTFDDVARNTVVEEFEFLAQPTVLL